MRPFVRRTPSMPALVLAGALCATSLAACGPDLRYERDASVPIPAGASWAWSLPDGDGLAPHDGAVTPADSIASEIAAAIEAELTSRGYPRAAADSAAFIVHYHVGHRTVTDTVPSRARTNPRGEPDATWGGYGRPEDVPGRTVSWEEGMLIVDVLPRDRRTVAWRGVIAGEIPAGAERQAGEAIRGAVRRLLRDFPEG